MVLWISLKGHGLKRRNFDFSANLIRHYSLKYLGSKYIVIGRDLVSDSQITMYYGIPEIYERSK